MRNDGGRWFRGAWCSDTSSRHSGGAAGAATKALPPIAPRQSNKEDQDIKQSAAVSSRNNEKMTRMQAQEID